MRWLVALGLAAALGTAHADAEAPWSAGVTAQQRTAAQKLLDAGNALFLERKFTEALEQYRRAVAVWDHPAIRFNIVRCLIQLDRGVEATENLELALKYGAAPLEEAVYAEAVAYQKLLANQVGTVAVTCTQAGVKVTLDGQAVAIACPGTAVQRAAPGTHQLVGAKPGFLTRTQDVGMFGGKQVTAELALVPLEHAGRIVHRWPGWVPWAVLGGGLVVSAIGAVLDRNAANAFDSYDAEVAKSCPRGCTRETRAGLDQQERAAISQNRTAVGVLAVGVAGTVGGAVLFYLNRGRTVYPEVAPVPGGFVVGASARF